MSLTDKQGAFCHEFLLDHNATQAAVRAGFSRRTAQEQASRLLSNVMVRREIDRLRGERSERVRIDADAVVRRLDGLYFEALAKGDLSTAARCLEVLAKCVGAFEQHNRQKRLSTPEEIAKFRAELEMRGVSFARKNFPPELVGVKPGHKPKVLPDGQPEDAVIVDDVPQWTR